MPYILLTLTDFYIQRESQPSYIVRFIIDKPSRSKLNTAWLQPEQCALAKYFVNDGVATNMFGVQKSISGRTWANKIKNPLPFSEGEFNELTSDTSCISSSLDNLFAEIAVEPTIDVDNDMHESQVSVTSRLAIANVLNAENRGRIAVTDAASTESTTPHANTVLSPVDLLAEASANDTAQVPLAAQSVGAYKRSKNVEDGPAVHKLPACTPPEFLPSFEESESAKHQMHRPVSNQSEAGLPVDSIASTTDAQAKSEERVSENPPPHRLAAPTVAPIASEGVKTEAVPPQSTLNGTSAKIGPATSPKPSVLTDGQSRRKLGVWGWIKSLLG